VRMSVVIDTVPPQDSSFKQPCLNVNVWHPVVTVYCNSLPMLQDSFSSSLSSLEARMVPVDDTRMRYVSPNTKSLEWQALTARFVPCTQVYAPILPE
jgi:hypothetical protein